MLKPLSHCCRCNNALFPRIYQSAASDRKTPSELGFTLVELMVSLVVGLLILFAASQVFLMIKSLNNQTSILQDKQASLNFMVESLARDFRRSLDVDIQDDGAVVSLEVISRESEGRCDKTYGQDGEFLQLTLQCGAQAPQVDDLVGGLVHDSFGVSEVSEGFYRIDFSLSNGTGVGSDDMFFHVMNRGAAFN